MLQLEPVEPGRLPRAPAGAPWRRPRSAPGTSRDGDVARRPPRPPGRAARSCTRGGSPRGGSGPPDPSESTVTSDLSASLAMRSRTSYSSTGSPLPTASAAPRPRPPAKTERRRSSAASSSVSSSKLHSMAAAERLVARDRNAAAAASAAGTGRRGGPRSVRPRARAARAAASSMASGMPSRRRQIWMTASPLAGVSWKPGLAVLARSRKSRTASPASRTSRSAGLWSEGGTVSGGTGRTASPAMLSGSWLVARMRTSGQATRMVFASSAHAARRCSQLSRTRSKRRLRR